MVVVQCLLVDNFEGTKIIGKLQMGHIIDSVYYYREAVLLVVIVQVDVTYQAILHL